MEMVYNKETYSCFVTFEMMSNPLLEWKLIGHGTNSWLFRVYIKDYTTQFDRDCNRPL